MHQSRLDMWTKSDEGRHGDHVNPDRTCGLRSRDGKQTDPPFEEPKKTNAPWECLSWPTTLKSRVPWKTSKTCK